MLLDGTLSAKLNIQQVLIHFTLTLCFKVQRQVDKTNKNERKLTCPIYLEVYLSTLLIKTRLGGCFSGVAAILC